MNQNLRMVWAAAWACEYTACVDKQRCLGDIGMLPFGRWHLDAANTASAHAGQAVTSLIKSQGEFSEKWSDTYLLDMLAEMVGCEDG